MPQQSNLFAEAEAPKPLSESFADRRARIAEQFEAAVSIIQSEVIDAGFTPRVAFSSGKDSLTTLIITCEALRRAAEQGVAVPTLHVTSADTGVENPEVLSLIHGNQAAVAAWGAEHNLPVQTEIVRPPLSSRLWVQVLSGRALPPHRALNRGNCSQDWKIRPAMAETRRIDRELAAKGRRPTVTLLGTRFAESDRRSQRMRQRCESSSTVRLGESDGYRYYTLSPIADWATEDVFAFLQDVGQGHFPSFAPDHQDTLTLYNSGAGAGCVLVPDPSQINRSGACGGRWGCWSCAQIGDDLSMRNLLFLDEHRHLAPLYRLRGYLDALTLDASARGVRITKVDAAKASFRAEADGAFSAETAEELLRLLLSIDADEGERAREVGEDPAFEVLSDEELVAIDYLWGVNGRHAPHQALRIAREVAHGHRLYPPNDPAPARMALSVAPRYFRIPTAIIKAAGIAMDDPAALSGDDSNPVWWRSDARSFSVDPESAALALALEADDWLNASPHTTPLQAAQAWLLLGTVAHPVSQRRAMQDNRLRGLLYRAWAEGAEFSEIAPPDSNSTHPTRSSQLVLAV